MSSKKKPTINKWLKIFDIIDSPYWRPEIFIFVLYLIWLLYELLTGNIVNIFKWERDHEASLREFITVICLCIAVLLLGVIIFGSCIVGILIFDEKCKKWHKQREHDRVLEALEKGPDND